MEATRGHEEILKKEDEHENANIIVKRLDTRKRNSHLIRCTPYCWMRDLWVESCIGILSDSPRKRVL